MTRGVTENEIRDLEIYEKRMRGASLMALGEEYGLHQSRISVIVKEVRKTIPQKSREELISLSFDQLEYLREKVIELANLPGAPVTAGQLGEIVRDPETEDVVRDYSLRLRAIAEAHRMNVTFAKRHGLEAPTQVDVKAAIQYEIVGVDPEALT